MHPPSSLHSLPHTFFTTYILYHIHSLLHTFFTTYILYYIHNRIRSYILTCILLLISHAYVTTFSFSLHTLPHNLQRSEVRTERNVPTYSTTHTYLTTYFTTLSLPHTLQQERGADGAQRANATNTSHARPDSSPRPRPPKQVINLNPKP